MISLVLSRRCCNEGQVRVCSMSVALLVLWYLLQAYLAARRWTISILLQCDGSKLSMHTLVLDGQEIGMPGCPQSKPFLIRYFGPFDFRVISSVISKIYFQ